ncbi:sensory neuron membrane protein 2 [Fopius arisanus]|uniref:Sensory neuron membrane protein 2 n=1 Tax=Fopius arisanus TaxID=64838 RepID=A0A9R1SUC8_9HYME|nr:PREDICTED: sensory neuron membrane protein 2 [Fopius arisanus]
MSSIKLNICFGFFLGLGIVVAILALVSKFIVFPKIINNEIAEEIQLINGSEAYDRWVKIPFPIIYKAYFFNVTNPEAVSQGEKPILQEVGPYIYQQHRAKLNITDRLETLGYNEHQLFEFDAKASYPLTDSDPIRIVNLPLMGLIDTTERETPALVRFLDLIIPQLFDNPKNLFLTTTPKDFLFDGIFLNCQSNNVLLRIFCKSIEKLAPRTMVRQEDGNIKFSFLSYKNNTDEGRFVVNSGRIEPERVGQLSSWNGYNLTNIWLTNSSCNRIFGTDATIYPPFDSTDSILDTFSIDLCRTVSLEYSEPIVYSGIDGLRFVAKKSTFLSPGQEPLNQCYCLHKTKGILGQDGCLLDGALELFSCHGAPIVFTHPHFYLTHQTYQNGVIGLKPNSIKHQNFVDLQPNTGAPLRGSKRGQFNIFLRSVDGVSLTSGLRTTLMPILWFDEGVVLSDKYVDILKVDFLDKMRFIEIGGWAIFACGTATCILSFVVFISCRCAKKNS